MSKSFYFTKHALIEMSDEDISMDDVKQIAVNGEVIRVYPEDPKGLSQLMLGMSSGGPLHVVCAHHEETVHIITAYRPSVAIWENDLRTKKEL